MACRIRSREDRELESKFKKMIVAMGIRGKFLLLNTVSNLPSIFKSVDAGIIPLRQEISGILEMPLVLLELALLKKPVIYGNVPPLDELAGAGVGKAITGAFPSVYAEELIRLFSQPDSALSLAEVSRNSVVNNFGMDKVASAYASLYAKLEGEKDA
jgi:glycosyltransferase involved in cell wall biosynthesis